MCKSEDSKSHETLIDKGFRVLCYTFYKSISWVSLNSASSIYCYDK